MQGNYKAEVLNSGDAVAAAAGTVIADSGALPAGQYDLEITMAALGAAAAGQGLIIEHRNAANNADVQRLGGTPMGCSDFVFLDNYTLALNERIRVIASSQNGAALTEVTAFIRARQRR